MARECLRSAQQLGARLPSRVVSEAYYAMLYAARAALSEEDDYPKTHRGVWGQFGCVSSARSSLGFLARVSRSVRSPLVLL